MIFDKKIYFLLGFFAILIYGCGSGSTTGNASSANQTSLSISVPNDGSIFAANIGETITNTYTFTDNSVAQGVTSATASTYSIAVQGLTSALSVVNNGCVNVAFGTQCNITISFAPQSESDYSDASQLIFVSGHGTANIKTLNISTVPSTLTASTGIYDTNKTSVNIKIGTASEAMAEIDTGSQLLVADFNVTNPKDYVQSIPSEYMQCYLGMASLAAKKQLQTDRNLTADYGCAVLAYDYGQRPVYGFMVNVAVSFPTINGKTIQTSPNTPVFISNNVNNQNGSTSTNSIIFGAGLNTQVSTKNYMPYPYNVMMMIDRRNSQITFGNFSSQVLSQYGFVQLNIIPTSGCINHGFTNLQPTDSNMTCWDTQSVPVVFSQPNGGGGTLPSLLDSGANSATLEYAVPPSWLTYNSSTGATTINRAYLPTTKGNITIQFASPAVLVSSQASRVNVGNVVFQHNKVLYNQRTGTIGLLPY